MLNGADIASDHQLFVANNKLKLGTAAKPKGEIRKRQFDGNKNWKCKEGVCAQTQR